MARNTDRRQTLATILAHIRIKPGMEKRFEEIAANLYAGTNEHETNVRRYEYWRGAEEGLYYTLLSFDDHNSFLVHQSSDHHEVAGAQLGEVMAGITLEWVDPIQSASPLAPTNMQDLPAGATPLMERYHQNLPAQVQEWWKPLR